MSNKKQTAAEVFRQIIVHGTATKGVQHADGSTLGKVAQDLVKVTGNEYRMNINGKVGQ